LTEKWDGARAATDRSRNTEQIRGRFNIALKVCPLYIFFC
jgi:hypothetical protein